MLKVPIYELRETPEPIQVGWITWDGNELGCEPGNKPILQYILNNPSRDFQRTISQDEPEEWLRSLPICYHGSYFWAEDAVEE